MSLCLRKNDSKSSHVMIIGIDLSNAKGSKELDKKYVNKSLFCASKIAL